MNGKLFISYHCPLDWYIKGPPESPWHAPDLDMTAQICFLASNCDGAQNLPQFVTVKSVCFSTTLASPFPDVLPQPA
jgi:hypothetical protein